MNLDQVAQSVRDKLMMSTAIKDWCALYQDGARCALEYGEDAMNILGVDDAPYIVVCPTENAETDGSRDEVGMVALAVGLVNPAREVLTMELDLVSYSGLDQVVEFAKLVKAEAMGAEFGCARVKSGDTDYMVVNKFPLFIALTGVIVVEAEAMRRAATWRKNQ